MNNFLSSLNDGIVLRRPYIVALGLLLGAVIVPAFAAATGSSDDMDWGNMAMKLLGGLALFLYGMEMMADSLKAAAGERMKVILARLTTNRFMGAATGALGRYTRRDHQSS